MFVGGSTQPEALCRRLKKCDPCRRWASSAPSSATWTAQNCGPLPQVRLPGSNLSHFGGHALSHVAAPGIGMSGSHLRPTGEVDVVSPCMLLGSHAIQ